MSVARPAELGGEREIDLRRWWEAILANRWVVVAGLVVGLVIGGLYSLSGGSTYQATVTIQPAQPFSPSGGAVLNYASSPLAIQQIATSPAAIAYVANRVGMARSELTGRVTTTSVSTGSGPVATRGTVLIEITVSLPEAARAEQAAAEMGSYIQSSTESPYVKKSLAVYAQIDTNLRAQLTSALATLNAYKSALSSKSATPLEQLIITTNYNDAITRYSQLQTAVLTNEQQQTLAQTIERAQIIIPAKAAKVTSRSRKDSVVFGGLIGLIIGVLVALALGLRSRRSAPAH